MELHPILFFYAPCQTLSVPHAGALLAVPVGVQSSVPGTCIAPKPTEQNHLTAD